MSSEIAEEFFKPPEEEFSLLDTADSSLVLVVAARIESASCLSVIIIKKKKMNLKVIKEFFYLFILDQPFFEGSPFARWVTGKAILDKPPTPVSRDKFSPPPPPLLFSRLSFSSTKSRNAGLAPGGGLCAAAASLFGYLMKSGRSSFQNPMSADL